MFRHDYSVAEARIRNAIRRTDRAWPACGPARVAPPGARDAAGEDADAAALDRIRAELRAASAASASRHQPLGVAG